MRYLKSKLRFDDTKENIVECFKYLQRLGVTFLNTKGFYGEDEGKKTVRLYTTALIELEDDEYAAFMEEITQGEASEEPNEETKEAIEEVQKLKSDKNKKTYNSFQEILDENEK